jgi:hypothetical protein
VLVADEVASADDAAGGGCGRRASGSGLHDDGTGRRARPEEPKEPA